MRRGRNTGSVYFEHQPGTEHKAGSDGNVHHRGCTGKWRGEVTVNVGGKQVRRRVSAKTKTEVYSRLKDLQDELGQGVRTSGSYTVADAVDDWLDGPMADRSPKTVQTLRELLSPLTSVIGRTVLRDLTADDVSGALRTIAGTRSTRTVRDTRSARAGDHLRPVEGQGRPECGGAREGPCWWYPRPAEQGPDSDPGAGSAGRPRRTGCTPTSYCRSRPASAPRKLGR